MIYKIDAQGKKIGRIASEAASLLIGKNLTTFSRNTAVDSKVEIINASKVDVTAKKKESDIYVTYTGFRGGLNSETLGHMIREKGISEVFRRAIYSMIPKNKLRDIRMNNLSIKE